MKLDAINLGLIFVGLILILVAAYVYLYGGGSESDRFFSVGILLIIAIVLFITPVFIRKEKK